MNVEGLRYAQIVAVTSSFSAAARTCGVSQPALSNAIAKLEQRLGGRLFERSTRSVRPTAFGAQLLPAIDRALAGLDAISSEAARLTGTAARRLRVGVSPLIDTQLVARAFASVRALADPHDLVLREANMTDLRHDLLAGDVDLILVPAVGAFPAFEHRIIDAEPVVVVGPGCTGATAEPIGLDETATPLILVPDSCGLTTFTTDLFDEHRVALRTYRGEAASYRVLEQWADLGMGAAILPRSKLSSPHVPHRPLHDGHAAVHIEYEAVWRAGSPLAPEIEVLVDLLAASGARARSSSLPMAQPAAAA